MKGKAGMESIMNTIEHSMIITNFVATVHDQLRNSTCKVFPDNVQYKRYVNGENKTVILYATIIALFLPEKDFDELFDSIER